MKQTKKPTIIPDFKSVYIFIFIANIFQFSYSLSIIFFKISCGFCCFVFLTIEWTKRYGLLFKNYLISDLLVTLCLGFCVFLNTNKV